MYRIKCPRKLFPPSDRVGIICLSVAMRTTLLAWVASFAVSGKFRLQGMYSLVEIVGIFVPTNLFSPYGYPLIVSRPGCVPLYSPVLVEFQTEFNDVRVPALFREGGSLEYLQETCTTWIKCLVSSLAKSECSNIEGPRAMYSIFFPPQCPPSTARMKLNSSCGKQRDSGEGSRCSSSSASQEGGEEGEEIIENSRSSWRKCGQLLRGR